ncbi:ABC transporter permease [Clostridium neuense]|uniref:ABC transporter permease n=1 Tax=Clostridium neuense TaxID=1728934 RepID=A0ABW8TEM6_9CLOT
MNAIYIALNVIKINLRDRKVLLMMMLLPIVLILILGSALKNASNFSVEDAGKTEVCYLNKDSGEASKSFDNFLKNNEIKKLLKIKSVSSYADGKKLVDDGTVSAMLYIDHSYTHNFTNDKKSKIQIYENEKSTLRNEIVKSIVDSYNDAANTIMTTSKITRSRTNYVESSNISENYISVDGKSPRAIDYYSVTMLVMILMYGANYGASEIQNLFYDRIGKRIKGTGITTFQHLIGVVFGAIFTLLLQALVLVLFTKYAYGSNWGSNPLIVVGVMGAMSIFTTSMGILFMSFTGDDKKASALISIVTPIFTFVSGGYFKVGLSDSPIVKYVPNQLAQSALFNSIYGGSIAEAQKSILIIIIMSIVILIGASVFARRKLV